MPCSGLGPIAIEPRLERSTERSQGRLRFTTPPEDRITSCEKIGLESRLDLLLETKRFHLLIESGCPICPSQMQFVVLDAPIYLLSLLEIFEVLRIEFGAVVILSLTGRKELKQMIHSEWKELTPGAIYDLSECF